MTIEEAKELIQQDIDNPGSVDSASLHTAQHMSVAALMRIYGCRHDWNILITPLLPGETKE